MDYCQDSMLIKEHYSEIKKSWERDMNDLNANFRKQERSKSNQYGIYIKQSRVVNKQLKRKNQC